jgi:hypothetical protein
MDIASAFEEVLARPGMTELRGSMSGGEALAQCLGLTLGYPVRAREALVEGAASLGARHETSEA